MNFAEQGTAFSVSVTNNTVSGSADASNPANNTIDGRADTYFRHTGVTTASLRLVFGRGFGNGLAIVGAMGVEAIDGSGVRLPVTVRATVGTSAGASDIYAGYRRIVAIGVTSSLNAPANAFHVVDPMTSEDSIAIGGGFAGTGSVYIDYTFKATALADWRIRGIGAWQGFAGDVKPNRAFTGLDLSEVLRSYAGAEFVNRKPTKRSHSATFNNIRDRNVFGGAIGAIPPGFVASKQVTATVNAVNTLAGTSKPVVWVPHSDIGTSGYTDAFDSVGRNWDVDNRAQSEIAWGYLTKPLEAREVARVANGGSQWEAGFTVVDAYNGVG